MADKKVNIVFPEWINSKFFENILKKSEEDGSIQVKNVEVSPATEEGEHFGSIMFRVLVQYSKLDAHLEEKSLIVKTMPFVDGLQKEVLESTGGLFKTEIKLYSEIIPSFQKALRSIGDKTDFSGKCLYTELGAKQVLVFEDLTNLGYKGVVNWGGNWEIAKRATEKLAKFHALSFKYVHENNLNLRQFSENFYTSEVFKIIPLYKDGYKNFLEAIENNPKFEAYVEKFENIAKNQPLVKVQSVFKDAFNGKFGNINVLNHGDFHIKNSMFSERNGKKSDVKLVDFQLSIFGTAVIDLIYMLYMFLDDSDRLGRRDEIIYFYFDIFLETLKKLKFSGKYPKLTDLYKDFLTFKDYEIMMTVTMLPLITTIKEIGKVDPRHLNTNEFRRSLYRNEKYLNYMETILPQFLYKGMLD